MISRLLARLLLVAAFLAATQGALQHPLEHLSQASTPAHEQCDACLAFTSVGSAAVSHASLTVVVSPAGFSATAQAPAFIAAFTPHFRSQAPPAAL